jgi:hypothetical protein
MKQKIKEWLKRYGWAEIISLTLTILSSWLSYKLTKSDISSAFIATWVGNIGYFGMILFQDIRFAISQLQKSGKRYSLETFYKNIRALCVEFGIAEIFDSLFIRPALLYYFPILLGNRTLGIIIAKMIADITFYVPAIISYELSKKKLRNFE